MKRLMIAGAGLVGLAAMTSPATAQDVAEFSKADAAAMLDAEPEAEAAAASATAADPAEPPNRAWSFGGSRPQQSVTRPITRPAIAPVRRPVPDLSATRRPDSASVGATAPSPPAPRALLPLQFALGSADLSPQSRMNLQNLADVLLEPKHLEKRVRIIGHADKSGSPEINRQLSEERAHSAVAYLERVGINPARLEALGVSSDDPLPNMSEYDPRNRRVEIERIR